MSVHDNDLLNLLKTTAPHLGTFQEYNFLLELKWNFCYTYQIKVALTEILDQFESLKF